MRNAVGTCTRHSGGSRGGAWARPPLFWVKKGEMTEGRKAGRASKTKPHPPPLPLAKSLDPPLGKCNIPQLFEFSQTFTSVSYL